VTGYGDAKGFRQGDEFDRAAESDWELDRAQDWDLARDDWLELHGEALVQPTLAEAIRQEGAAKREANRRQP
jgi:hypothetical protein